MVMVNACPLYRRSASYVVFQVRDDDARPHAPSMASRQDFSRELNWSRTSDDEACDTTWIKDAVFSCRSFVVTSPWAQRIPGEGGTITGQAPSSLPSALACKG